LSQETQYFAKCDRLLDEVGAEPKNWFFDMVLIVSSFINLWNLMNSDCYLFSFP